MEKVIFIVIDGLGDLPVEELGDKTPLEAADTPNLDFMARNGFCSLMDPSGKRERCESDVGHLHIFGYEKEYCGRGPLEALGLGMELKQGDIVFRSNFATLGDGRKIIDRRAGRIGDVRELAKSIDDTAIDGCRVRVIPGISHRAALVLSGPGLGENVSGTDAEVGETPKECLPRDLSEESSKTAKVLNKFSDFAGTVLESHPLNKERVSKNLLPANCLLVRGAGKYRKPVPFGQKYGLKPAALTETGLYRGIARFLSMDIIDIEGITERFDTNLGGQIEAALRALEEYDFIYVHIKPTDVFGHDGKFSEKKRFVERLDTYLGVLRPVDALVVVTADHSTPCALKDHSGDPVPILFYGKEALGRPVKKFSEKDCAGMLISGKDVMPMVMEMLERKLKS